MIYHREFTISSCHFNGSAVYKAYRDLRTADQDEMPAELKMIRMQMLIAQVLVGTHGHNFKIAVEIDDHFEPINDFMVDDAMIESVVMQWDNTNLSVHDDFKGLRATTENMAYFLSRKIMRMLPARHEMDDFIGPTVIVTVHETDQIFARSMLEMADMPQQRTSEDEEAVE